uniref:Uncharacterized protein n=2 Tax=Emiliania huxleyi TaxID=2903 RepID=A0A0D3JZ11_EMIH1
MFLENDIQDLQEMLCVSDNSKAAALFVERVWQALGVLAQAFSLESPCYQDDETPASAKTFPEETASAGIDEWTTPSPLRKIERKGKPSLVDCSKNTTPMDPPTAPNGVTKSVPALTPAATGGALLPSSEEFPDTTCYPGLPTPMAAGKSGPASARSGSGPGYVDGVEAAVRRLGESVSYQAAPADGEKSPSPGVPTSGGIAPVAPKPLSAVAGAGQAEAEAAKEREHWEGRLKKAKAALDLIAEQREKWADLQSRRSGKCRRKAMRCRNNPKFGKAKGRRKSGKAKGRGRRPNWRREPQTTSGKAPFAAGTCGAGAGTCGAGAGTCGAVAGTCGAGGRAALKAAANCVQGGYTKAEGAFRWLLLVCMPAFGHCASAVPSPTAVASAFSSAVASAASSAFSSGVASAASSAFSSGVASAASSAFSSGVASAASSAFSSGVASAASSAFSSGVASAASSAFSSGVASAASSAFSPAVAASSLVSCSPLLMPTLVLILLAIACGASWPTAASGKGARGAAHSCLVLLCAFDMLSPCEAQFSPRAFQRGFPGTDGRHYASRYAFAAVKADGAVTAWACS